MSSAFQAVQTADGFLDRIKSADADIRFTAWRSADTQPPEVIGQLADLVASPDKGIAKAAKGALEVLVFTSGAPDQRDKGDLVADELLKVASAHDGQLPARVEAIYLLGFVADHRIVPGLAALLDDMDVRDEARMALERMPGQTSLNALVSAARLCIDSFRTHLNQSIANRAFTPANVGREPRGTEAR